MAFVKKSVPDDPKGLTRLVVFRESKKGHLNSKARFHAVQCVESDPKELVEMIKSARSRYISETVSRKSSANSLDSNWIISGGGQNSTLNLRHQSGTDSVRSATIRRNGAPSRGSIPFRGKESADKGGIPVMSPVPPGNTKEKLQKKPSIPLGKFFEKACAQKGVRSERRALKKACAQKGVRSKISRFCSN